MKRVENLPSFNLQSNDSDKLIDQSIPSSTSFANSNEIAKWNSRLLGNLFCSSGWGFIENKFNIK